MCYAYDFPMSKCCSAKRCTETMHTLSYEICICLIREQTLGLGRVGFPIFQSLIHPVGPGCTCNLKSIGVILFWLAVRQLVMTVTDEGEAWYALKHSHEVSTPFALSLWSKLLDCMHNSSVLEALLMVASVLTLQTLKYLKSEEYRQLFRLPAEEVRLQALLTVKLAGREVCF